MDCCREVVETPSDGLNRRFRSTRHRLTQFHGDSSHTDHPRQAGDRFAPRKSTLPCEAEARTVQIDQTRLFRIRSGAEFHIIYMDKGVKGMDAGGSSYGTYADHIRQALRRTRASLDVLIS